MGQATRFTAGSPASTSRRRTGTARATSTRASSLLLPALVTLAVVYGSWLPFDLDAGVFLHGVAWASTKLSLDLTPAGAEDTWTNLLLYVPLGLLWAMAAGQRCWWLRAALATGAGAATSLVVEVGQVAIVGRVPSLLDVLLNTAGSFIGGCLAGMVLCRLRHATWRDRGIARSRLLTDAGRVAGRLRAASASQSGVRRLLICAGVLEVLVMIALAGGHWIIRPQQLDFSEVAWLPFEALWRGSMITAAATGLYHVLAFAMLALVVANLASRLRPATAWLLGGSLTVTLAVFLEAMQLVVIGGTPDLTVPVLALVGVLAAQHLQRKWPAPGAATTAFDAPTAHH